MDWIAAILELIGSWNIGNKKKIGFVLYLFACILWIIYVFYTKSAYGLLGVVIPAILINIRNLFKWKNKVDNIEFISVCYQLNNYEKRKNKN